MPVELLVPIVIFLFGVVVAIATSSLGIERLVQSQNNK